MQIDTKFSPWNIKAVDVVAKLNSSEDSGLSTQTVLAKQQTSGKNILVLRQPVSVLSILYQQVKSIIVILLLTAAIISFFLGQWIEALSVLIVLVINTFIGFITEYKAIRSMEALRKLGKTTSTVLRDGSYKTIDADELVPGDIINFEAGDIISADARIIRASRLSADESSLTGESVPIEKDTEIISADTILAERKNMLYRGTFLTNGSGSAIVTATGMQTEIGKIAKVTQEAHDELTPLEKRLESLGKKLIWISLAIAFFVAISGILSGKDLYLMLETAVALAVASIPEGLPIVATIALAKGMWHLAKKNVLVNKLSAVETLGATSIILTDKTGTLTENKMSLSQVSTLKKSYHESEFEMLRQERELVECLKIAVLCNNAILNHEIQGGAAGDPMEIALLTGATKAKIFKPQLLEDFPELKEEAFSPESRMMATYHQAKENIFVAVKGAPEAIIKKAKFIQDADQIKEIDNDIRIRLEQLNMQLAQQGLRVIAVASKQVKNTEEAPYENLTFQGFLGLLDPARADIQDSIAKCHKAGIRVAMATGDQAHTAKKIAKDVELDASKQYLVLTGKELGEQENWNDTLKENLANTAVFSRVSPTQKLNLIEFFQKNNFVVAMTGDGVNDAPALKKADIGVAMGLRGTQVARDAADMILGDDKFTSIILAIKQGRIIFSNIQKFVIYLLSCNISEVLIVSIATIVNAPLPLLPLQILFLNLVTDVFPALALGMGEGDETYLYRPPRKKEDTVIGQRKWYLIFFYGGLITLSVLAAYFITLNGSYDNASTAVTVSFLTLGFAQVFHVFNMRLTKSNIIFNDITKNSYIWGAVLLCFVLLLGAVYISYLREILSLCELSKNEWLTVGIFSLLPLLIGNIANLFGLGINE